MPSPLGDLSFTWPYYAVAILGYLLGSIPFGLVLTRLAGYGDIRKIGSGNIGATNVLRTGNRPLALAVLILDGGKGAIAVLLARYFGPLEFAVLAGGGAVLGHIFPVWLMFRGGKGVATTLGTLVAISPLVGALTCLTWLLVAWLFRYSSLAAIMAMIAAPLYAFGLYLFPPLGVRFLVSEVAAFLTVIVVVRHAGNIRRLLAGTESRIGQKKAGENNAADAGSSGKPGA